MLASQSSYRRTIRGGLVALAAAGALLAAAPSVSAAYTCGTTLDDFDRADSTNVGSQWTERAPDFAIAGQRATNPGATPGLMTFNNFAATEVCVDVATNGAAVTNYAGVALRYGSLTQNLFVKVQRNGGGTDFNTAYFYVGNNGAGTPTPSTVALTPFSSGRLHVFVVGNRVTLDVDTNFDGTPEQSFGSDYPAGAGTGTEVALVSYGGSRLDNFRQPTPNSNPQPTAPTPGAPNTDPTAGKPTLSALGLSSSAFKAARSGPAFTAASVGTTVRYTLSEAGKVRYTVQRKTRGRRLGGRCVKRTRANRNRPRCTRWVNVSGSFTVTGKAGTNRFRFRGRIGGKRLKLGSYRLNARATDSDGNKSALRRKAFRIVR